MSVEVFHKDPFLGLYFSLFFNDLPASLPFSVSCSLYADDLDIWSSFPSVPIAVEATQDPPIRLRDGLSTGVFLSVRANVRPPSSQWIPTKLTSSPTFSYSTLPLSFYPTETFLGVTFDRTLSFSKHVSSLKAKFFPRLNVLRCTSASSWSAFKESLSLLYKTLLRPLLIYALSGWFPFLRVTNTTKLKRLHQAASRSSAAVFRPTLFHFSSLRLHYLL